VVLTERCHPYAGNTHHLVGSHRGKGRLGRARIILYKFAPGVSPPTRSLPESITFSSSLYWSDWR
jgi:hypothetical protein